MSKQRRVKRLSVAEAHQLRIAKRTVKMPDAMVNVMGGSKAEARGIVRYLEAKEAGRDEEV